MKSVNLPGMFTNVRKNLWLLCSAAAALSLFLSTSLTVLVLIAAVFAALVVVAAFDAAKPADLPQGSVRIICILLTVLMACLGFVVFNATWMRSNQVVAFTGAWGVRMSVLLKILGAVGCIVGFYAMYILSCRIVLWAVQLIKELLPVQEKSEMLANLKRNWYFPISAMAYFCLEFQYEVYFYVGLVAVLIGMVLFATQVRNMFSIVRGKPWYVLLLLMATGIGICWRGQAHTYIIWEASRALTALSGMLPVKINLAMCVSVFGAVAAFAFVLISLAFFWTRLFGIFRSLNLWESTSKSVLFVCLGLFTLLVVISSVIFLSTEAFYGPGDVCDMIYTSDSAMHLKHDVYLSLTYYENDLRQPFFAVFASPFMGLPYLIGRILNPSYSIQVIIINAFQIAMLIFANYVLTRMLKLSPVKSICFMVLSCCTYSQMLAVLMIEQYIVAYFWLVLCVYLIAEKKKPDPMVLYGAGGTLLTSLSLLPLMSTESPIKNFMKWLNDVVKCGVGFVGLMLVLGRLDVFYNLFSQMGLFNSYTGKTVTAADKVKMFSLFVHDCIFAPDAGVNMSDYDHVSWQLHPATAVSMAGILILVLAVLSAILNRDKRSGLVSAGWVGFCVVVLAIIGWGTKENGLILYSLYFGWAFFVLLFQLVEKIESKLNIRWLVPVITVGLVAVLLAINIPAMMELVNFGITYYPV